VKADLGIRVGDLVKHTSYKNLLGIVIEINVNYAGTPVAVAWTGHNPYGLGKNNIHHPDRLEVIRNG
tara:strand:- start:138 stop:338 length:201 start_codon:yes stop_codon:yes gene_type:complete